MFCVHCTLRAGNLGNTLKIYEVAKREHSSKLLLGVIAVYYFRIITKNFIFNNKLYFE